MNDYVVCLHSVIYIVFPCCQSMGHDTLVENHCIRLFSVTPNWNVFKSWAFPRSLTVMTLSLALPQTVAPVISPKLCQVADGEMRFQTPNCFLASERGEINVCVAAWSSVTEPNQPEHVWLKNQAPGCNLIFCNYIFFLWQFLMYYLNYFSSGIY